MKLLSRILGKKLFKRFALWWYRITGQPATFPDSGVYGAMVALRAAEYDGPRASFDVLEIRPKLQDARGFILPQYAGDGIHCNALAYNDVFYPVVAKYIRGDK